MQDIISHVTPFFEKTSNIQDKSCVLLKSYPLAMLVTADTTGMASRPAISSKKGLLRLVRYMDLRQGSKGMKTF